MFKDKQLRKDFEEFRNMFMENVLNDIMDLKKQFNSIHPCFTCKALFRIEDLQKVESMKKLPYQSFFLREEDFKKLNEVANKTLFFCPSHKVPYDRIQDGRYYKDNVEIDETTITVTEFSNSLTSEQWLELEKKYNKRFKKKLKEHKSMIKEN